MTARVPLILTSLFGLSLVAGCSQPTELPSPRAETAGPLHDLAPIEPSGFTVLTDWPMDSTHGGGWRPSITESGALFIVQDPTSPGTRPNVGLWFQAHSADGAFGATAFGRQLGNPPADELWLAFWLKLNCGWQGGAPLLGLYYTSANVTTATSRIGVELVGAAAGPPTLGLTISSEGADNSHLENSSDVPAAAARRVAGNVNGGSVGVTLGHWHRVAVYLKRSSGASARDGRLRWWLDQTLVGDYRDVNFAAGVGYNHVSFDVGYPPPAADTIWEDDIRISRPGPLTPDAVADLRPAFITTGGGGQRVATWSDSVRIRFTQVDDGTGLAANYDIRYATGEMHWDAAPRVTEGTCAHLSRGGFNDVPMLDVFCSVAGLSPSTTYQFQLVPYRGTLDQDAVFGPASNILTLTTEPGSPPPSRGDRRRSGRRPGKPKRDRAHPDQTG